MLKVNNYRCPLCNEEHETLSNYSTVVCNTCINMYGVTTEYEESMTIGFDKNKNFYTEIAGVIYRTKECYVRGYPCYIRVENGVISIIATTKITKKRIIKKQIKEITD